MSRQIQFRRGTADEHAAFTGAIGEVTVDTTNKTLRVHDGQTPGGIPLARADAETDLDGADYVIAWQTPTAANNYTWYRKYKSGWVEQGGHAISSDTSTPVMVNLLVQMADINYCLTLGIKRQSTASAGTICVYEAGANRTVQSFGCVGQWSSGGATGRNAYPYNWIVAGFAA